MPKYIRTKDTLFKVVAEDWLGNEDEDIENMELDGYWVEPHSKNENYRKYNRNFIRKDKVIKSADTIEELVDKWIVVENGIPHTLAYECDILDKIHNNKKAGIKTICYGAIFTVGNHNEPILKSVAKMNEKEKLCLI